jgi:hypothetical protein
MKGCHASALGKKTLNSWKSAWALALVAASGSSLRSLANSSATSLICQNQRTDQQIKLATVSVILSSERGRILQTKRKLTTLFVEGEKELRRRLGQL